MKKVLLTVLSLSLVAAFATADDCCATKKADAKKAGCGSSANCGEDAFMAEAKKMMAQSKLSETGKEDCCKSTEAKPMAKGDAGCCNAKGEVAKFKVFIAGVGYKYFGCEESAGKERSMLLAKHSKVGPVQKVAGKVMIH